MIPKLYIQRLSETDNTEKDKIINLIINKAQSKCPIKGLSVIIDIAYPYVEADIHLSNMGRVNLFSNVEDNRFTITANSLYVHPDFRKGNMGSTLLYLAEQIAKDIGFDVITLEVQEDSWMQKWYRKKGYREYGYSSKNKDLIWMLKQMK